MAKRILVVAATAREHRELPKIAGRLGYELIFEDWDWSYFDDPQTRDYGDEPLKILPRIEAIRKQYEGRLDGITSAVGYPGMSVVAILSKLLGLPGPSPDAIMRCEHKYYSRLAQEKFVPEATSHFTALNVGDQPPELGYPRFLKPIKSFMSMNAQRVDSPEQVVECLQSGTCPTPSSNRSTKWLPPIQLWSEQPADFCSKNCCKALRFHWKDLFTTDNLR
ncbi:MAG: hypothetical protein U0105_00995 [Candidatus Obscuribacterales bacterium]